MSYTIAPDGMSIRCHRCGLTSHHLIDVANRYCGQCNVFHGDVTQIFTVAYVPNELAQRWLQHLRDFDVKNPGCHFQVLRDGPKLSFHEMIEQLRVEPELTVTKIIKREKKR